MTISIETTDITLLAKALNNALIGYADVVNAINLCCEPAAPRLRSLNQVPQEELTARLFELKNLYIQIENIERRMSNDS